MLASIDNLPVIALDTNGSSDAAMAERFLDYETTRMQMMGGDDNIDECRPITADGSGRVAVDTDWLAIKGAGPHKRKKYILRGTDYVWDGELHTYTITTANTPVYLDIIRKIAWDDCAPRLKNAILASATQIFQRRMKGDPQADLQLQTETARALIIAEKDTSQEGTIVRYPIPNPQQQRGPMNG